MATTPTNATDELKDKTFTISAAKLKEMNTWVEEHNKTCRLGPVSGYRWDVSGVSKFTFTFRPGGLGDNEHIVCDCGETFYSSAGDENL